MFVDESREALPGVAADADKIDIVTAKNAARVRDCFVVMRI
jgi:hypothetical protein